MGSVLNVNASAALFLASIRTSCDNFGCHFVRFFMRCISFMHFFSILLVFCLLNILSNVLFLCSMVGIFIVYWCQSKWTNSLTDPHHSWSLYLYFLNGEGRGRHEKMLSLVSAILNLYWRCAVVMAPAWVPVGIFSFFCNTKPELKLRCHSYSTSVFQIPVPIQ